MFVVVSRVTAMTEMGALYTVSELEKILLLGKVNAFVEPFRD